MAFMPIGTHSEHLQLIQPGFEI